MLSYCPSYFNSPKLADKAIQELRIRMHAGNIGWLQYCMADVKRMSDNEGKEWGYYGLNNGEDREYKIAPESHLNSLIFFEVRDANYSPTPGELSKLNISLTCWFNKEKLSAAYEDTTNLYLKKCLDVLRFMPIENVTQTLNRDDVFDFSGLKENKLKPIIGKYGGFRINFDFYFDALTCYNLQNMTALIPLSDSGTFVASQVVNGVLTITHTLNTVSIIDVTIKGTDNILRTLNAEPKVLTINTVEVGVDVLAGIWNITARPTIL